MLPDFKDLSVGDAYYYLKDKYKAIFTDIDRDQSKVTYDHYRLEPSKEYIKTRTTYYSNIRKDGRHVPLDDEVSFLKKGLEKLIGGGK